MGYLASEFRGGITFDVKHNLQIPTLHENFFEFVEKEKWECEEAEFVTLDKIENNKQYYIFVTTQNGLYRYHINDLIQVNGRLNNTPTFEFIQKGKGVTNLTGEKLYEGQLVAAMTSIIESGQAQANFFKMLADPGKTNYSIIVESKDFDVSLLEKKIGELNLEFCEKRNSGRLQPTDLYLVKEGTGEAYKRHCLKCGQREGQFKMNYLEKKEDCGFNFENYTR